MTAFTRHSTGSTGLDSVLGGGFIRGRSYLLHGPAGAGKTILGFQFLQAGLADGDSCLFINLEEDIEDLRANAAALGFDVDGVEFLDLSPDADVFTADQSYSIFEADEVEQEPVSRAIVERVEGLRPDRVVVDPITQFRYLTGDEYQFRKQIVGFMRFLKNHDATVLFTGQETEERSTDDLQFISDGTVHLDRDDGGQYLRVPKFRGSSTRGGIHTYRITDGGIEVYPALQPGSGRADAEQEPVSSGVPEVDALLKGGFDRGTVSVVSGPTGVGKTTLGTQFMKEAASRGERSVVFLFEESRSTYLSRSSAIGIPVHEMIDRGTLCVEEVDALDQSAQEFATRVREEVEERGARIVMVDGIAGYRMTLHQSGSSVLSHLHSLGRYLKSEGVTGIFVDETADITGSFNATEDNISYLADSIVFLRHIELRGELQKAIGVLKKRTGDYERTLRQFEITPSGIRVGEPLTELRGVLTGTPEAVGIDGG